MRWLIALALACAACKGITTTSTDGAVAPSDAGGSKPVFESCTTLCVRPGDCAVAYPDDDLCPSGFRCSRDFTCTRDAGTSD